MLSPRKKLCFLRFENRWAVPALGCVILRTLVGNFTHLALADEGSPRVLYVNADASGTSDGSSWAAAYQDLQDALDDAREAGDVDAEIWIAAGTYTPDRGTSDQTMAFELFGNVATYGGFAGFEECRDERDPTKNTTILNGDLNGDDDWPAPPLSDCCKPAGSGGTCSDTECYSAVVGLDVSCGERWREQCSELAFRVCCDLCRPTRCDNSYNVVRAPPGTGGALDGLVITGGEAYDLDHVHTYGGGLYANGSPHVSGCRFERNRALTGSALYADYRPVLEKSVFAENGGFFPGGHAVTIRNYGSIGLKELTVVNNLGGGIEVWDTATISDSIVAGNRGHGLFCFGANCTLVRSQFVGNADKGVFSTDTVSVIESLFLRNSDNGLYAYGGVLVINSVFAGNTGFTGAALG